MPADTVHRDDEALVLLALGSLAPDEARAAEEHLAGCEECRRRLGRRLGELAALADAVEPVAPPAGAREALLARLGREEVPARGATPGAADAGAPRERRTPGRTPSPPVRAPRRPARLLLPLAASFLLGAVAGVVAVRQAFVGDVRRLGEQADTLVAERDAALRRAEDLSRDLAAARAALSLAPAPEAVLLAGLPAAPDARGRVFVDRAAARAVFVARGLPALPEGRTYQLWRIVDGQPRPAGLLDDTEGAVIVEDVGPTPGEVWAVTVEPQGGREAPSGEMVLLSS